MWKNMFKWQNRITFMEGMATRPASKKDIPVMLELLYELGRPKPRTDSDLEVFGSLVEKYISDQDKQVLVAELDGKVVGAVSMEFMDRLNQTCHEVYVPELIVAKEHQNRGIGRELINACMGLGRERGCFRIRLESGHHRTGAHRFYRRLGFDQSALTFEMYLR